MILGEHVKTAVVFLADGFEEVEALSPVDYLRRAGVEVTTLATGKDGLELTGARGIPVRADMKLTDYLAKNISPDLVVVPGGMPGAVNVASCKEANELIKKNPEKRKAIEKLIPSVSHLQSEDVHVYELSDGKITELKKVKNIASDENLLNKELEETNEFYRSLLKAGM